MNKLNSKLSDIFDIEPIDLDNGVIVPYSTSDDDAEYARTNIRSLIEKGTTAMGDLLTVAKASEHPRAYEVAANFIKNLADLNKDLLEIQKRKKEQMHMQEEYHLHMIFINIHLKIVQN